MKHVFLPLGFLKSLQVRVERFRLRVSDAIPMCKERGAHIPKTIAIHPEQSLESFNTIIRTAWPCNVVPLISETSIGEHVKMCAELMSRRWRQSAPAC